MAKTAEDDGQEQAKARKDFAEAVNMTPAAIEKWLGTDESRSVGVAKNGADGESVGHDSGRKIVAIKRKKQADLTAADYAHMKKVVGYVHRHMKQGPAKDAATSRWRYSLMNWGHDPCK